MGVAARGSQPRAWRGVTTWLIFDSMVNLSAVGSLLERLSSRACEAFDVAAGELGSRHRGDVGQDRVFVRSSNGLAHGYASPASKGVSRIRSLLNLWRHISRVHAKVISEIRLHTCRKTATSLGIAWQGFRKGVYSVTWTGGNVSRLLESEVCGGTF